MYFSGCSLKGAWAASINLSVAAVKSCFVILQFCDATSRWYQERRQLREGRVRTRADATLSVDVLQTKYRVPSAIIGVPKRAPGSETVSRAMYACLSHPGGCYSGRANPVCIDAAADS
jgi:hypothetical protein